LWGKGYKTMILHLDPGKTLKCMQTFESILQYLLWSNNFPQTANVGHFWKISSQLCCHHRKKLTNNASVYGASGGKLSMRMAGCTRVILGAGSPVAG
jgi:hypothetical protein